MDDLRHRVEEYLARTGTKATNFGLQFAGDGSFVFDLRKGRQVLPPLRRRILAGMKNRPNGLKRRRLK